MPISRARILTRKRAYMSLVMVVVLLASLVLILPGALRDNNVAQVNGVSRLTSFQALGQGRLVFFDDFSDPAVWHLSNGTVKANLATQGSLNFSVAFESNPNPQAASVNRELNLSLDEQPVAILSISVSKGISYGIRFYGNSPDGTAFSAWREDSYLQHRKGQGTLEAVSADLALESFLSTRELPVTGSRITRVLLYVEATPGTSGVFSLTLTSFSVHSTAKEHVSTLEADGNYTSIVIGLNSSIPNVELFQVFLSFYIAGSSDSQYTPFLLSGQTVLAQGTTYRITGASRYVLAVLKATLATALGSVQPPILTGENSTSLAIVAKQGSITHFQLDSIALRYSSQTPSFLGFVDQGYAQFLFAYYVIFLFITPIAAVILLGRVFKSESKP